MELLATIEGLTALKCPSRVRVTTDPQYVKKGITEWMENCREKRCQKCRSLESP